VKELLKLANMCQSYHKNKRVSFFNGTQCTCTIVTTIVVINVRKKLKTFVNVHKNVTLFLLVFDA